jgi:hypothetical protein
LHHLKPFLELEQIDGHRVVVAGKTAKFLRQHITPTKPLTANGITLSLIERPMKKEAEAADEEELVE